MIDLVLLDVNMPEMNGLQVLEQMNRFQWINKIPVIIISADETDQLIHQAYAMGVTDYVRRPFDAFIVRRRVENTLNLYTNQKRLAKLVSEQIREEKGNNELIVGILSHVVEFRNYESGDHIRNIRNITKLLLRHLVQKTNIYHLSEKDIAFIKTASALHDIGKIAIPEEILNKPGKLTPDKFSVIKTHTTIGAEILEQMSVEMISRCSATRWKSAAGTMNAGMATAIRMGCGASRFPSPHRLWRWRTFTMR